MRKKETEYLKNGIQFRRVPMINGSFSRIETQALVGICHNPIHKGYLSVTLLKKHDCINKGCRYLEKFEDYPYWVRQRSIETEKNKRKEEIRQAQQEQADQQKKLNQKMETLRTTAQEIANELGYQIHITRVAVLQEIQISRFVTLYEYVVNFTSDAKENDNLKFFPLALRMRKVYGGKYFLRHIRGVDGNYLTTEEWEKHAVIKR